MVSVTVLAREGDERFEADPETRRVLLDAMAQCERGETILMTRATHYGLYILSTSRRLHPDGRATSRRPDDRQATVR